MKRLELVLPVLMMGSLWGVVEVLPLPVFVLIGMGVAMLTLGRFRLNMPGSSTGIGLIACLFKAYSMAFYPCNWAGILAVAVSYDVLATVYFRQAEWSRLRSVLVGGGAAAGSLFLFLAAVLYLVPEPIWIDEGMPRILDYALGTILPAIVFSVAIAPLAHVIGRGVKQHLKLAPLQRFSAGAVAATWVTATILVVT